MSFGGSIVLILLILVVIGLEAFLVADSIGDVGTAWGLSATFMGAFVIPLSSLYKKVVFTM